MAQTKKAAVTGSVASFGVQKVKPLDYSDTDNQLTTKVYHGVSIVSGTENIVGRIQSWAPDSYTREGVHLYELADLSWGRPVEYVPGRSTGYTIAVTRAEVWNSEMERAFGVVGANETLLSDLQDQVSPFIVKEFWLRGSDAYHIWVYRGCWFQSKNFDALASDGDGITRISATLAYVSHNLNTNS